MKATSLVVTLVIAAFVIGCESNSNGPVGSSRSPQYAFKILEVKGIASRLNDEGEKEYLEVSGTVKYSIEKLYEDEQATAAQQYQVTIEASFDLKANGSTETVSWKAGGSSSDLVTRDQSTDPTLVKSFSVQGMASESTFNIGFAIANDDLVLGQMWITR